MPKLTLPHDVSPFLQTLRDVFLGRNHLSPLRFPKQIAPRTIPEPDLPEGCNHKLASNYYFTRDGRRLVTTVDEVYVHEESEKHLLAESTSKKGDESKMLTVVEKKAKTPGTFYLR